MPFCPNCGSQVEGRFCARCGTSVDAAPAAPTPQPPEYGTPAPVTPGAPVATSSGLTENVASALCYLLGLITGILFLALAPYNQNRNIRFHAFQSIFFHVGVIALWIVLMIVGMVMPWFIKMLLGIFSLLLWLGVLFAWLFLMWKAYNNQKFVLPIVGPMAEKQA